MAEVGVSVVCCHGNKGEKHALGRLQAEMMCCFSVYCPSGEASMISLARSCDGQQKIDSPIELLLNSKL